MLKDSLDAKIMHTNSFLLRLLPALYALAAATWALNAPANSFASAPMRMKSNLPTVFLAVAPSLTRIPDFLPYFLATAATWSIES